MAHEQKIPRGHDFGLARRSPYNGIAKQLCPADYPRFFGGGGLLAAPPRIAIVGGSARFFFCSSSIYAMMSDVEGVDIKRE